MEVIREDRQCSTKNAFNSLKIRLTSPNLSMETKDVGKRHQSSKPIHSAVTGTSDNQIISPPGNQGCLNSQLHFSSDCGLFLSCLYKKALIIFLLITKNATLIPNGRYRIKIY